MYVHTTKSPSSFSRSNDNNGGLFESNICCNPTWFSVVVVVNGMIKKSRAPLYIAKCDNALGHLKFLLCDPSIPCVRTYSHTSHPVAICNFLGITLVRPQRRDLHHVVDERRALRGKDVVCAVHTAAPGSISMFCCRPHKCRFSCLFSTIVHDIRPNVPRRTSPLLRHE